jgi:hypothetical protein
LQGFREETTPIQLHPRLRNDEDLEKNDLDKTSDELYILFGLLNFLKGG